MREKVIARFAERWQCAEPKNRDLAVEFLTKTYDNFVRDNLADREFDNSLVNGTDEIYMQRTGELLLADWLRRAGFSLSSKNEGPDFKAEKDGVSIWLELVTPTPQGIDPRDLIFSRPNEGRREPCKERSLRWTSAIKEKRKSTTSG